MKLPRWLLASALGLSALLPVVMAGWWWINWPARAVRHYVELIADGRIEDANRMMKPPQNWSHEPGDGLGLKPLERGYLTGIRARAVWQKRFNEASMHIALDSRTRADVLAARGICTMWWPETIQESRGSLGLTELQEGFEVAVERGQISIRYKTRLVQ